MHPLLRRFHTGVDEPRPGWNTPPAYVLAHGVGRGAETNCQVGIGAVPVFKEDRPLAHLRQLAAPLNPQAGALHPRVELDRGRFWMAN